MVKVTISPTPEALIAVLNLEPPSPDEYARFLQAYWRGVFPDAPSEARRLLSRACREWSERTALMLRAGKSGFHHNPLAQALVIEPIAGEGTKGWSLPNSVSRKKGKLMREALVSAQLRVYLDKWIDSGRALDGSESPLARSFTDPAIWSAAHEYLKICPPVVYPSTNLEDYEVLIAKPRNASGARNLFESSKHEAMRLLVGLMASDRKERLCRCRHARCGRYFLHPNPRPSYLHGTFCFKHQRSGVAVQSTKSKRTAATDELIERAAGWLVKHREGPTWSGRSGLKSSLAEHLSTQMARHRNLLAGRNHVKVNWVTRHRREIERRRLELARQ